MRWRRALWRGCSSKNGKKEAPAEQKLMQPTKTVWYDKILVTCVTDLFFSWRWRPPSWSTMSTLSCYHMIDVCYCLVFLKIERQLRTNKKSVKWFVLTSLHKKRTFVSVNVLKSYVYYILLWKFGKSQLQVPHHQNSSQLYHNIFTPIKHGAIKEVQNQHRHEGRRQRRSRWVHWRQC